jgi:hypothetical protein
MQYANPDEDKFFLNRGAKPPERTPHLTDDELEDRFEQNRQRRHCTWQQQGPEVFCSSCSNRHGMYVGTTVRLEGIDAQGLPILGSFVINKL